MISIRPNNGTFYDGTAAGNTYDSLNRLTNMVDGVGTTVYSYDAAGQLLTEDGPFASDTVTNTYASRHRIALALQQPTGVWTNGFVWDVAGRLFSAKSPAGEFDYSYSALTPGLSGRLVNRLALPNSAYITNEFDPVARLSATILKNSGNTTLDSSVYVYNTAGQRTNFVNAGGTNVQYGYDNTGQLTLANSSNSAEDRGYAYDRAWNLNYLTNNGAVTTYTVDVKNQLTAVGSDACHYDANGNLTNYPNWINFMYDDENRLTRVSDDFFFTYRTGFVYDGLGRLRKRLDYQWQAPQAGPLLTASGSWVVTNTVLYVYDGWRVIQERDTNNNPQVSYTRGLDLSGTFEGAGGIGGLLAWSGQPGTFFYHADGNGNIMCLIDANQTLQATYRYDPYGNTTSSSGPMAAANTYRFSSKELMVSSGLYYYGYRFYSPALQRWLARDPLGKPGFQGGQRLRRSETAYFAESAEVAEGPNLYRFVGNTPVTDLDPFGLAIFDPGQPPRHPPGPPPPSLPPPSRPPEPPDHDPKDPTKTHKECALCTSQLFCWFQCFWRRPNDTPMNPKAFNDCMAPLLPMLRAACLAQNRAALESTNRKAQNCYDHHW